MKILLLTALFAAVACNNQANFPWQAGKLYRYEVQSHTLARLQEGASSGTAFRSYFIVRVKAPGHLQAKLENPQHAKVHQQLPDRNQRTLPQGLKYEAVQNLEQPFEIFMENGRVLSLKMPAQLPLAQENLLKGLISALQVDLSTHRTLQNPRNNFDKQSQQGQFRKMETDVTGDCATLYTVSPAASEWRRELQSLTPIEEPIVITKSKNYGHCHHRVAYHFGVPQGAEWTGTANQPQESQFIDRATNSRILVGRQGPIFKAETTSTVNVHPHVHGQQKAEVLSHVWVNLLAYEDDNTPQWEQPENSRVIQSLMYSMSTKQRAIHDRSSESLELASTEDAETRVRRSTKFPRKIVSINKIILKRNDNSENVEDSSSDSTSAYVNDDIPQQNEPAYAALYMNSQAREVNKQNPVNAQKLVQEIAQLLQNPNNMPKSDFLAKFNILVRVIAGMDLQQLSKISASLESAKNSNNQVKADMWMIYRDAVAQAGTLPAFKQIVSWIQTKKIQGEEAAQIVATLPSTLRYPTKEAMIQLFRLAMDPMVVQQQYLGSTALIAATRLINMAQVNNETAHSFYPTHMYGRLARQHDNFVQEEILPRLQQALEQAIQQQDSRKAQVYIKAIGKLGHRSVLDVYAPYLEGKVRVSTYLRALMVDNLSILARQKDIYVRAALFNILRNTAEHEEVRLAAIQNIFMTHPTSTMMQAMAQMTHDDPSVQVRAALKSGIESAAEQKNPRHMELARTAQAARPMLTKERFSKHQSTKSYGEYFDSDYQLGIMDVLSTIGSQDSMFPKFLRYAVRSETNGWSSISSTVSSMQQLVDKFQQKMNWMWAQNNQKTEANHKYSAEKISEMLNIKREPQDPLEAALYINLLNQQRYFAFSEQDLQKLPNIVKEGLAKLAKGVDMHYTKVLNQAQISVMFPVATGMPFFYRYKEPTVVHILVKAKGQVKHGQEFSADIQNEIQFTYARNIDGNVGFLDTLSNEQASAGVVNKVQLHIPMKVDLQMKEKEVKIQVQALRPEQDTTIVHYSVWPYTTIQKKDTLTPISLDPNTKQVTRTNKILSIDSKFGQAAKTQYQLQGYSYSNDYQNLAKMYQTKNFFTNLISVVYQKDVALTHFNFRYLGSKSQNKVATFTAVVDELFNLKENGEMPVVASKTQDVSPNSAERRAQMVKRVSTGINTAKARVIDLSAVFDGQEKAEFVFTGAMASSQIDPKIQYSFVAVRNFPQGSSQINGVAKVIRPEVVALNAHEALKQDLKIKFEADVKFGENENGNIRIQAQSERTRKFAEALQKHQMYKKCAEQMSQNNFYQPACHKTIVMAHAPDFLKATVNYKDVSPAFKYAIFQAYRIAEQAGFWFADVNPLKSTPEGKLEIEVQNNYLENMMNLALNSKYGEVRIRNTPIPRGTAGALATYSPISASDRVANYYNNHLYQPYCSVDENQIKTFSNRQFQYTLSPSWHLVMHNGARKNQQESQESQESQKSQIQDELVVLTRRQNEKDQEIYISYKSKTGQNAEIEIQPAGNKPNVQVKTNAKKVSEGQLTMYWDDVEQVPFLEYFNQPDGVLMLYIRQDRLRLMTDGQRLVVLPREGRNNTRGICGLMSGEPRDDYLTPAGLVDSEQHFGASYALQDSSDQKTQELYAQAQQLAYQRRYKNTQILKSDEEWQQWQERDSAENSWEDSGNHKAYRPRAHGQQRGDCQLKKQVQYTEDHEEICISTEAVNACPSHCKFQGQQVQAVQVVCSWKSQQQQQLVQQIRQGQNPQVSGVPQIRQFRVPSSCQA